MTHISDVLSWKFPGVEGIVVKGDTVTQFPGGIPSQADQDTWTTEYTADLAKLRADRDALLVSSDWTQVADAPGDTAAWATYRQQLRDLPANTADPANPTWPTAPE